MAESLLSQTHIHTLGWMLLHFVWQAIAVATALAISLTFIKPAHHRLDRPAGHDRTCPLHLRIPER
jgi:hypothetical protein